MICSLCFLEASKTTALLTHLFCRLHQTKRLNARADIFIFWKCHSHSVRGRDSTISGITKVQISLRMLMLSQFGISPSHELAHYHLPWVQETQKPEEGEFFYLVNCSSFNICVGGESHRAGGGSSSFPGMPRPSSPVFHLY